MYRIVSDNAFRKKTINFISKLRNCRQSSSAVELPESADVVIIGGGIAGCNTLYQLSKRGVNAVLLERAKLTSGTTWHTAGLVWSLRPSDLEVQLLADSRAVYSSLEEVTGQYGGWINNGGMFISRSKVRTDEYLRLHTLGKAFGIPSTMMDPQEATKLMPIMDPKSFQAALYSPYDGTIDPAMACAALTKYSKDKGNKVFEECPVYHIQTDVNQQGNKEVVGVSTTLGTIKTKCIVNCAGAWGSKVGRMAGLPALPLIPFKHAYVVSDTIPELRGCPNVRDHDYNLYLKIQGESVAIGGYEPNPHMLDDIPDVFEFQLYELDWDVFGVHVESAANLCPKLGKVGIKSTVCGPESFTPDHKPLLGEDSKIFGLYHNCGYNSAGMMFSAGTAIQMADWILKGRPSLPMFTFDVRRFTPAQLIRPHWVRESSHEAYARNYALVFPHDEPLAGRDVSLDALHQELVEDGAVMQNRAGWERPAFFVENGPVRVPRYDWGGYNDFPRNFDLRYEEIVAGDHTYEFSKHHDLIGAEALACRQQAALFNMSYYGKFYLTGPEAVKAAELAFTADLSKKDGRVVYTCVLNKNGGVEADLTVSVIDGGSGKLHEPIFKGVGYYIVSSGFSANHTFQHLKGIINKHKLRANINDVTLQMCILSIQGPDSQRILQRYTDVGLSNDAFPVNTHRSIHVSPQAPYNPENELLPCRALRVGWAGELGWELHVPSSFAVTLYKGLSRAKGLKLAGWRALTSLSAEKGYHLWNSDVRPDDNPVEANLIFTCRKDGDYIGSKQVNKARENGVTKKYAFFTLDEQKPLLGHEAIWRNGQCVGYLRRGDYGFHLKKPIGIGYVHDNGNIVTNQYLNDGDYELEIRGIKYKANLHLRSPFDPKGLRILGNYEDIAVDENTHEPHTGQNERTGGCE